MTITSSFKLDVSEQSALLVVVVVRLLLAESGDRWFPSGNRGVAEQVLIFPLLWATSTRLFP